MAGEGGGESNLGEEGGESNLGEEGGESNLGEEGGESNLGEEGGKSNLGEEGGIGGDKGNMADEEEIKTGNKREERMHGGVKRKWVADPDDVECTGCEDKGPPLTFQPTNGEWRVRQCSRLGLPNPLDLPERDSSQELGVPCQRDVIVGDGNCLYHALSLEVCGTQELHTLIREKIVDILCHDHAERFSGYVGEDLGDYLDENTLRPHSWGSDVEIFAAATLLQTTIMVYTVISETSRKWLPHKPLYSMPGVERSVQNIYLSNLCGHFERVVKVSA